MAQERKKIKGVCTGLVVRNDGESICGGVYSALMRGECRMIPLDARSEVPEVLAFANDLANTFIEVDRQWQKKAQMDSVISKEGVVGYFQL
ncbi:hypothetical protein [Pelosinus sp. sgz500959]|uniref:hypothetical protein n=1 Tax=Pelosinus sp. sgz500959 TaxID=3242472 RepID=UPI00366DC2AC